MYLHYVNKYLYWINIDRVIWNRWTESARIIGSMWSYSCEKSFRHYIRIVRDPEIN